MDMIEVADVEKGYVSTESAWDVIIIGSGIGGLACAAALSKHKHRVLVIEQHMVAGGLTATFSREGYTFNLGVHYLGGFGLKGEAGSLIRWLTNNEIQMASLGAVYDTVHFPDGFRIEFSRPETSLRLDLKEKFPESIAEIDSYFDAIHKAKLAGYALFRLRALPKAMAILYRIWKKRLISRWCTQTTENVLVNLISDPKLRAVLSAQWGTYGSVPQDAPFAAHAVVTSDYYDGAFYPIGGPNVFADALGKTIESAGGRIQVNSKAVSLIFENGCVIGVRLENGTEFHASAIVSAIGVRNTIKKLLSGSDAEIENPKANHWRQECLSLSSSQTYVCLYLGFEGDIQAHGATVSNHWIYETWNPNHSTWNDPVSEAVPPKMFVSFPSLKDPSYIPGSKMRHTAEIIVGTSWEIFREWADAKPGERSPGYAIMKSKIQETLLGQFRKYFPALVPLIRYCEVSTPLTLTSFTGADEGAMYGLKMTPRRLLAEELNCRSPIPGLFLAGQDVITPGVHGAMMGGVLAAASIDARIFSHLT